MPLLAACLLTGCTHIGALATTSDGNGVWVATNTTYLGLLKEFDLYFCNKDLEDEDWACTKFEDSNIRRQLK